MIKRLLFYVILVVVSAHGQIHAQTTTLIHYWNFNKLGGPYSRPVPAIKADYSVIDTNKAYLEYYVLPGTSSTWAQGNNGNCQIDNVAGGDTSNLRNGATAGLALRARNPVDSSELRWHIPTTGFTKPVVKFVVESSSTTSGDSTHVYSYSTDGGTTWRSTGMTVNGANVDTLDVTQPQYQGSSWGLVTVTFGNDATVDNNPNLIFRIVCRGNTHLTGGNNRYDDFSVDASGSAGPPPAIITVSSPAAGVILIPGRHETVSFKTLNQVGSVRTIDFSADGGTTWTNAGTVTEATTYDWVVPNTPTVKGMIRVRDSANVTGTAGSFIIYSIAPSNKVIHYWNFNTLGQAYNNPNIPDIPSDFSADLSHSGSLKYVLAPNTSGHYAGYLDPVPGDTLNALFGSAAGQGLRVRNPTDSMELRFVIPTNGYKSISIRYALQTSDSSLTGSAPHTELFDYSTNGGTTWTTAGLTVNGAASNQLNVHQKQYGSTASGAGAFGSVAIGFGTETSVENNANLVFRIRFADSTHGTSGNNRFDNISVQGTASASVASGALNPLECIVAPNPAYDHVDISLPISGGKDITILDIQGKPVQSFHTDRTTFSTSVLNVAAGTYYVLVHSTENGKESIVPFVKE